MSGNWGWIPTRRSHGSRRRRVALSVGCVVAGLVLVGLFGQSRFAASSDITGAVLIVVGLLIVGLVWDLRPWSDS